MKIFEDNESAGKTPIPNAPPEVNTPPGTKHDTAEEEETSAASITSIAEEILSGEHPVWLEQAYEHLSKLDGAQHELKKKRSILALLAAEFTGAKKGPVYERPEIVNQTNLSAKWNKDPIFSGVMTSIRKLMLREVEEIELKSMRQALALSRIATVAATRVRIDLLDNPSPWVKLQAARDIMNTAISQTGNPSGKEVDQEFTQKVGTDEYAQLLTAARNDLTGFMDRLHDEAASSHGATEQGAKPLVIENDSSILSQQDNTNNNNQGS